jgi:folate-binding protein YgfZ
MQNQFQQTLLAQGARLDQSEQVEFSNLLEAITQLPSKGVICSLDHLGCIRASGEDATAFLQGQFSNDISLLQHSHVQISAYCNPKGRMLAQFLVIPDHEDFLLLLPRSLLEPTLKRLRMFVLRSKVTLTDVSNEVVCLGLAGATVAVQVNATLSLPVADYQLLRADASLVCQLPAPQPRYLVVTNPAEAVRLWQHGATSLFATDQHLWHWLDIQAGLPSIWPQTLEEFVPQMVNLEIINGVSFSKGCYPGQEIVARMHYLGKPKRRMYHLITSQAAPPQPGTDIYVAGSDGQSAGKVVIAEPGRQGGCECLAVLQNDKLHAELRLGALDGPKLDVAKLPYTLESP